MYLACNRKPIPSRCEHDPTLRDCRGYTVAMYLTIFGAVIPTQWEHDPTL